MKRKRMHQLRHKATGETALIRKHVDGLVWAQFDRLDHPHSHGWHLYRHKEFERMNYE